jgi:hypothetical protein
MSSHDSDEDDPLLGELRGLFAHDDPVPPLVTETAKASLGWRRLDADLAELLSDSLDTESHALVRGGGASLRSVSFAAGALTVDVEIRAEGAEQILLGQLSPITETTVEVRAASDPQPTRVRSDQLGRFRATVPAGSSIRLRVAIGDPDRPEWIETSWISV